MRGRNWDGPKYYGIAQIKLSNAQYEVMWTIEGKEIRGIAERPVDQGRTLIKGDYEVAVLDRSENGVYYLAWGTAERSSLFRHHSTTSSLEIRIFE